MSGQPGQYSSYSLVRGGASSGSTMPSSSSGNVFARLSVASTNPDWMPTMSKSSSAACPAPPVPVGAVATTVGTSLSSMPTEAAAPRKGLFSMLYSGAGSPATSSAQQVRPTPPMALDAMGNSPVRPTAAAAAALPVDVGLPLTTSTGAVATARKIHKDVTFPQPIGGFHISSAVARPLALGSDTWNAVSGFPSVPTKMSAFDYHHQQHGAAMPVAPPSIDDIVPRAAVNALHSFSPIAAVAAAVAPKPLRFGVSSPAAISPLAGGNGSSSPSAMVEPPTLDAFRNVLASATASIVHRTIVRPTPPQAIATSPVRDPSPTEAPTFYSATTHPHSAPAPLIPVGGLSPIGEENHGAYALHTAPLAERVGVKSVEAQREVPSLVSFPTTTPTAASPVSVIAPQPLALSLNGTPVSMNMEPPTLPAEFSRCIVQPSSQHRRDVQKEANMQAYLTSLFSEESSSAAVNDSSSNVVVADTATTLTQSRNSDLYFDALEAVTGKGNEVTAPSVDYSTFFSTGIFDDQEDDGDESMEQLRAVVNFVLHGKSSTGDDTSSSSGRKSNNNRTGGGGGSQPMATGNVHSGKYTESSSSTFSGANTEWNSTGHKKLFHSC